MSEEGSRPISYARTIFNIPEGTIIGKVYINGNENDEIEAESELGIGNERFTLIAREELNKAKYSVLGGENLVFAQDESAKARYQLGAEIVDMDIRIDIYQGMFHFTSRSSGSLSVKWQLYDTFTKEVVFSETTRGLHQESDRLPRDWDYFAFRRALRKLLANEAFASLMDVTKALPDTLGDESGTWTMLALETAEASAPLELPKDMETVLTAVVDLKVGSGGGSGFLVSPDGYIVTAAHVVSGTEEVTARLRSGLELPATVERVHERRDLALLKIPGTGYPTLPIQAESSPVGSDIYAIGSPGFSKSLDFSVAKGIVSAERDVEEQRFLQTDVSINPGNSGGPLVNTQGQAIGVVSWKVFYPGFEGLAFAIPARDLNESLKIDLGSDDAAPAATPTETVPVEAAPPAAEDAAPELAQSEA